MVVSLTSFLQNINVAQNGYITPISTSMTHKMYGHLLTVNREKLSFQVHLKYFISIGKGVEQYLCIRQSFCFAYF